jgi:hypothetical protein
LPEDITSHGGLSLQQWFHYDKLDEDGHLCLETVNYADERLSEIPRFNLSQSAKHGSRPFQMF